MTATTGGRRSPWGALPDLEDESTSPRREPGRLTDFVLFALLPMALLQVRGLPVQELAVGLAVVVACLRPARVRPPTWLWVLLPALMALFIVSAQLNDLSANRRLLHVGVYVVLALVTAQGRFNANAMAKGLTFGLIVSAGAWFVGYGTSYEGRLAGLMADPNVAGYTVAVLGCLAMAGLSASRFRVGVGLALVVIVVLTYSRTSLLAVAIVLVWLAIGRRLSVGLGSLLLLGMTYVAVNIPADLQTLGPFAERAGSDALRRRIFATEQLQIAQAPWYGNGPGTSKVEVLGEPFFFHNSYLALQNEGGRIAQVLLLTAGALTLIGLLRMRTELRNPWYEGALIAVAVCAANLGEVLLELPTALALGMAAAHLRSAGGAAVPPPPRLDLGMVSARGPDRESGP